MMVDIIAPLVCTAIKPGYATAYFARPLDLKTGTLKQRLLAVRPTIFLGVPRVWEKFMEGTRARPLAFCCVFLLCFSLMFAAGMQAVGKQMPDGLKKKLVAWAKRTSHRSPIVFL
jgi:long-subunit acyl-CoA synthetase (AMP-forming)